MPKQPTLLTFIGPAHHIQLTRPIEHELEKRGWLCKRYTASTEACFQAGLHTYYPNQPYYWLPDYIDKEASSKIYNSALPFFQSLYTELNAASLVHPITLDRIVYSIAEEYTSTEALIKEVKPSATLALHEINRWGRLLGYHSYTREIPFYTLQEGLYYGDKWLYEGHTHYSHSLVWGEATKSLLLEAGAADEKIHIVGHPDLFSRLQKRDDTYDRITNKKKIFLFFTNVGLTLTPDIMEGWNEQEEYILSIRCHQMCSVPFLTHIKEFFSTYRNVIVYVDSPYEEPTIHFPLMNSSDICLIFGTSSLTLEWLANPRPLGVFIPPIEHSRNYTKDPPVAINVSNHSIYQAIKKTELEWEKSCKKAAQEWFLQEIAFPNDGVPRIANIIEKGIH